MTYLSSSVSSIPSSLKAVASSTTSSSIPRFPLVQISSLSRSIANSRLAFSSKFTTQPTNTHLRTITRPLSCVSVANNQVRSYTQSVVKSYRPLQHPIVRSNSLRYHQFTTTSITMTDPKEQPEVQEVSEKLEEMVIGYVFFQSIDLILLIDIVILISSII